MSRFAVRVPDPVDRYDYWSDPPPQPSPRLLWWVQRFQTGRRPEGWMQGAHLGYDSAAEWYGVYIWEWCNVLSPLISGPGWTPPMGWDGGRWVQVGVGKAPPTLEQLGSPGWRVPLGKRGKQALGEWAAP